MRIVFMGTPEFAVPSLHALFSAGYEIAGVFSQPDRPSGRGHKLMAPPVKEAAIELGLPIFQFERIRRKEGIDALRACAPELVVTAAFGQILSKVLLAVPPRGTVNVHASLLPAYRGPAPINWCIINGEAETGVTTMYTDAGVDTGDTIYARRTPIGPQETAGELTRRLADMGAELIVKTLADIIAGTAPRTAQNEALASHYPMLSREAGAIDWALPGHSIDCLVRGVDPWPGATTLYEGTPLKIWKVRPAPGSGTPGEILRADANAGLVVACKDGAVEILSLQAPGKSRVAARDWLRGHSLPLGGILGGNA